MKSYDWPSNIKVQWTCRTLLHNIRTPARPIFDHFELSITNPATCYAAAPWRERIRRIEFAELLSTDMKNKLCNAYRNYKRGDEAPRLVPYFAQISIKKHFWLVWHSWGCGQWAPDNRWLYSHGNCLCLAWHWSFCHLLSVLFVLLLPVLLSSCVRGCESLIRQIQTGRAQFWIGNIRIDSWQTWKLLRWQMPGISYIPFFNFRLGHVQNNGPFQKSVAIVCSYKQCTARKHHCQASLSPPSSSPPSPQVSSTSNW